MKIKNFKSKLRILFIVIIALFFSVVETKAQEPKVDYNGEISVDSDLDGLTDKGETQIYQTNPGNPDTDGDGKLDGAEILNGANPLNANDPNNNAVNAIAAQVSGEVPWVWYLARAAGLIGFTFLWIAIFLGLSIRNPLLKKIIKPVYSFDFHCFVAALSVFWALVHASALLFDAKIGFGIKDVAISFFSKTTFVDADDLALGIMAFYMMAILVATSYLKKHLNHKLWRVLHFLNPVAFIFVVAHGYSIGTDIKNFWVGSAFLFSSFLLVLIYFSNLAAAAYQRFRPSKNAENNISQL